MTCKRKMKKMQLTVFLLAAVCLHGLAHVRDVFTPLSPNSIHLNGYLEGDIQNSIIHWNKGIVPYSGFVQMFKKGRSFFAQGEMWGKAVRSGCMFYRYTRDPELKKILQETVKNGD